MEHPPLKRGERGDFEKSLPASLLQREEQTVKFGVFRLMEHILIIGARSDLGTALGRLYAAEGFHLYLAARNARTLCDECRHIAVRYGANAKEVELDLLDYASHEKFWESLDPKPVGVICTAGYLGDNEKAFADFAEARKIMETNYLGCVSVLNICARHFEERKSGFIVGVSSVAGDRGRASNLIYGSAKAGFTAYLSGLRNRLAKSGVRVLTVKPGFMATKMTEGLDLPPALTASPADAARDVFRAQRRGRDVVYTKWFWKLIMWIIIHIPERLFKKLKL